MMKMMHIIQCRITSMMYIMGHIIDRDEYQYMHSREID
jgi:hypothetical protein